MICEVATAGMERRSGQGVGDVAGGGPKPAGTFLANLGQGRTDRGNRKRKVGKAYPGVGDEWWDRGKCQPAGDF